MAKLKIYTFPDQVLKQKAQPIARVDRSYHQIAEDMLETMYAAPGIGLAANQVGLLERILVLDVDYEHEDIEEKGKFIEGAQTSGGKIKNKKPIVIINPRIVKSEGSILFCEGCLSVPEYSAEVKRFKKIELEYQDLDGLTKKLSTEGLLAVAIQHEIDHLDGKLFIDRLSPLKKEMVKKKLIRLRKDQDES